MHLHFVQSLEPLQGAGLGQAALSLHLAMRETKSLKDDEPESAEADGDGTRRSRGQTKRLASKSVLLSTRAADFDRTRPDVIQRVRNGPAKAYYAPELKRLAGEAVEQAEWFHGHGLYVWTNMWLGASDHAFLKN